MRTAKRVPFTIGKARRKGKRDAREWRWLFFPIRESKAGYPPSDQREYAAFEMTLKEAAENDMQIIARDWEKLDIALKRRYCQALNAANGVGGAGIAKDQGSVRASTQQVVPDADSAEQPQFSPRWALFWLVLLGILEGVFNSIMFQVFGASRLETLFFAGGFAICVPLAAHLAGKTFKKKEQSMGQTAFSYIISFVALAALFGAGVIRAKYLAAEQPALHAAGIEIGTNEAMIIFFLINLLFFCVSLFLSYEAGLEDPVKAKREHELRKRIEVTNRDRLHTGNDLAAIKAEREKMHKYMLQDAMLIKEHVDMLCRAYRDGNLETRKSAAPPCFNEAPPTVTIPSNLTSSLDWNCLQVEHEDA